MKLVLSLRGAHINYSPIVDPNLAKTYREMFPHVTKFHAVCEAIKVETTKYVLSKKDIKVIKVKYN